MVHGLYFILRKRIKDPALEFVACSAPPPLSPWRGVRTASGSVTWRLLRCLSSHEDHEEMKLEPCVRIQFYRLQCGIRSVRHFIPQPSKTHADYRKQMSPGGNVMVEKGRCIFSTCVITLNLLIRRLQSCHSDRWKSLDL